MSTGLASPLGGVLPVLSVPFTEGWSIDEPALRAEMDWLFSLGVDGVVVGMVSEILRMDVGMRRDLAEVVVASAEGRGASVIGVGAESTPLAVELAAHAARLGATAVMVNGPLTSVADDDALEAYFRAIADATGDTPVVVQDASGYVGRPLATGLLLSLLDSYGATKIQFKPEAEPLGPRMGELIAATGGRARVFDGSGGRALVETHVRGAVGTMPGPDLAWAIVPLWDALQRGDLDRADALGAAVSAVLSHTTSLDSYIAVEKHLLVQQGVITSARALGPTGFRLDPTTVAEVDRLVERLRAVVSETIGEQR
ncbi:dihydrodipicolinate synthase family protein [Microbacterium lushaniae]|uniref:dihydrodipicolinate synthase family protein n=1 Tax=Microbacterium lushaniae TaxID=2614639 RepID=UPI0019310CC1|nr:dihydrodipicolinate synthase family protein [Microbacterium lushaniae]